MRRWISIPVAFVVLLSLFLIGSCDIGRHKYVFLIGWDGAQRNHVNECLSRHELPTLAALISEGSMVNIDIKGVTDTKAGWTQILTGYLPAVTGVYSNSQYQAIPSGLTIFERLEAKFGDDNVFTAAVVGKKGNVDNDPPQKIAYKQGDPLQGGTVVTENGQKFLQIPAKPYYYTSQNIDFWQNNLIKNDVVGKKAIELIGQHKGQDSFYFIHFAEVDTQGHAFGENSKEYNDALISSDYWTGQIVAKLKELGIYKESVFYVTADHGFDEGMKTHNNAPYIFLASSDKGITKTGWREDIAPTIMDRIGLDLSKCRPPLDGRSLYN
jgi:predicted AlkP superfamily pyrophosphatase or phosphodiesterase